MIKQVSFEEVKKAVLLSILPEDYYRVPMIMGERGTGKTSLGMALAEENGWNFLTIDANVLKEGEIGGLPYVVKYKNEKTGKQRSSTEYVPYFLFQKTWKLYEADNDNITILFIDELNRCDVIVKRELMNIILNRSINGYELPPNVRIICACNPSSNWEAFRDTDYQVEDMDEAQIDRFMWIILKSDIDDWIPWAMQKRDGSTDGRQNIHPDMIEYLLEKPKFLNNVSESKDDIKTSPRSWEASSHAYYFYLENKEKYQFTKTDLLNNISGNIGLNVATDFMSFLENQEDPLIKPAEIFEANTPSMKKGKLEERILKKISSERNLRKNYTVRNCLAYIINEFNKEHENVIFFKKEGLKANNVSLSAGFDKKNNLFIEIMTSALKNNDLMYAILSDITRSKSEVELAYARYLISRRNKAINNAYTKLRQSF